MDALVYAIDRLEEAEAGGGGGGVGAISYRPGQQAEPDFVGPRGEEPGPDEDESLAGPDDPRYT